MKANSYFNYLLDEIHSHFYRMKDKDGSGYHNSLQNLNLGQIYKPYDFPHTTDFFNFYLNIMELTPKEIVQSFSNKRMEESLWELIYDGNYSFFSNRKELHEIFKEYISTNFSSYSRCLSLCLKNHLSNEQSSQKTIANFPQFETIYGNQKDMNAFLFNDLIKIGFSNGFIKQIDKEIFHTKNDSYKKIIEELGLLKNEQFSKEQFSKLIVESFKVRTNYYNKEKLLDKLKDYQLHYVSDIFQLVKTYNDYQNFAQNNLSEPIREGEIEGPHYIVIKPLQFMQTFISEQNKTSRPLQSEFIKNWFGSIDVRKQIIEDKYNLEVNIKNFPEHLLTLLKETTEKEYKEIFANTNFSHLNFTKNSYQGTHIHNIANMATTLDIPPQDFKDIINVLIKTPEGDTPQIFKSALLNFLAFSFLNRLEKSKSNPEDITQNKLEILKIAYNNKDIIFKSIDKDNEEFLIGQIGYIKKVHDELHFNKKALNISSQELEKIDSNLESTIKNYLLDSLKNKDNYYYRHHSKNYVECFKVMVEELGSTKSLDKEFFNLSFLKPKLNKKGLENGQLYDFPVIFELVQKSTTPTILSFVFQKEHLPELLNTFHHKKNLLEYTLDTTPHQILPILNVIKDDSELFKILILDNKKILRQIKTIENEEVQTLLQMMDLNQKITKNISPETISKKNKI